MDVALPLGPKTTFTREMMIRWHLLWFNIFRSSHSPERIRGRSFFPSFLSDLHDFHSFIFSKISFSVLPTFSYFFAFLPPSHPFILLSSISSILILISQYFLFEFVKQHI